MFSLEDKRRMLQQGEKPTMDYVIQLPDGSIGEASTPFYLCDLLFHPDFTDCEDPVTWFILTGQRLRDIASTLSMERLKAIVYDAKGAFYDNTLARTADQLKQRVEVENPNTPIIFDGYDPWTSIASLIKSRYILLWEKKPTFSDTKKLQGCSNCVFNSEKDGTPFCQAWDYKNAQKEWEKPCFWLTCGESTEEYQLVSPEMVTTDMSHRPAFRPVEERNEEFVGLRYENIKEASETKVN